MYIPVYQQSFTYTRNILVLWMEITKFIYYNLRFLFGFFVPCNIPDFWQTGSWKENERDLEGWFSIRECFTNCVICSTMMVTRVENEPSPPRIL